MRLVQIQRRLKDLIKNIIVAQHVQDTQYKERNRADVSPSPSPRHPTSPVRSPNRSPRRGGCGGETTTAAKDRKLHIKPTLLVQSPDSRNQQSPEGGAASPSKVRGTRSTDLSPSRLRTISQDDVPQELQLLQMNASRTNVANQSVRFKRGKSNLRSQRLSSTSQLTRPETPPYIRERKALSQKQSLIPMRRSSPSPPILLERHSPTPEQRAINEEEQGGMVEEEQEVEEEKILIPKKNLSNYLKALTESDIPGTSPNQKNKNVISLQRVNEATQDVQNMDTMSEFKNVKLSKIQSPSLLAQTLRTKHHLKELFRNQQQVQIREEQQARERIRSQRIQQAIASAFHNLQQKSPKEEVVLSKDVSPASFKVGAVVNVPTPKLEVKLAPSGPDTAHFEEVKRDPQSGISIQDETSHEQSYAAQFLAESKSTPSIRLTPRKIIRMSLEGKMRLKASEPPLHSPKQSSMALQTIEDAILKEKSKLLKKTPQPIPVIHSTPSISPFRVMAKKQRQFLEKRRQESQPYKIHSFIQKYSRHETLPTPETLENEIRTIDVRKSTEGPIEPYQLQGSPSIPCYLPKSDVGSSTHTPLYHSIQRSQPNQDLALVGYSGAERKGSARAGKSDRGISKVDLEFNDLEALKSSRAGITVFGMTHGEQIVARSQNNPRSSYTLRKLRAKVNLEEEQDKPAQVSQIQKRLQQLSKKKNLVQSEGKIRKKLTQQASMGSFQVSSIQPPQLGFVEQQGLQVSSRALNTIENSFPKIAVPPILSQDDLHYSSIMESEDRSTVNNSRQMSRRSLLQTPVGMKKDSVSFLDRVRSSLAFNIKGQRLDQSIEQISLIAPPQRTKYYNFNLDYRSIGGGGGQSKTPPPVMRSAQRSARSQKSAPQRREQGLYKKARERAKLKRPKISNFQQK